MERAFGLGSGADAIRVGRGAKTASGLSKAHTYMIGVHTGLPVDLTYEEKTNLLV